MWYSGFGKIAVPACCQYKCNIFNGGEDDLESVFNFGEEALSSDGETVRVVKRWLGQSKSQAARNISKADSEAPSAKKT